MSRTIAVQIDNEVYDRMSDHWWSESGFTALLRYVNNPWRISYFQRIICQELHGETGKRVLDVGCGGGILAEELVAMGLSVTGVDRSLNSIEVAREHARQGGLTIDYRHAAGEKLPFKDASFEIVCCCDVLEHVSEWEAVVGEAARVLKPGGVFFYDTINRTAASRLIFIKMGQEWRLTRFMPPNLHVWEMFIKPEELAAALARKGLIHRDVRGAVHSTGPLRQLLALRQFKSGKINAAELVRRVGILREGANIEGLYMGYALKPKKP